MAPGAGRVQSASPAPRAARRGLRGGLVPTSLYHLETGGEKQGLEPGGEVRVSVIERISQRAQGAWEPSRGGGLEGE